MIFGATFPSYYFKKQGAPMYSMEDCQTIYNNAKKSIRELKEDVEDHATYLARMYLYGEYEKEPIYKVSEIPERIEKTSKDLVKALKPKSFVDEDFINEASKFGKDVLDEIREFEERGCGTVNMDLFSKQLEEIFIKGIDDVARGYTYSRVSRINLAHSGKKILEELGYDPTKQDVLDLAIDIVKEKEFASMDEGNDERERTAMIDIRDNGITDMCRLPNIHAYTILIEGNPVERIDFRDPKQFLNVIYMNSLDEMPLPDEIKASINECLSEIDTLKDLIHNEGINVEDTPNIIDHLYSYYSITDEDADKIFNYAHACKVAYDNVKESDMCSYEK